MIFGNVVPDRYKVLIPRNSPRPPTKKEVFTPLHPANPAVKIEVYQGEQMVASENTLLGEFKFENLKAENPNELAKFTVEFDFDVNGILTIQAADRGSKQKTGITVQASHHQASQRDLSSQPLPDVRFDLDDLDEAIETVTEAMRYEAEILLNRARILDSDVLKDDIQAVERALDAHDGDMLQDALEELSDALFDLEK